MPRSVNSDVMRHRPSMNGLVAAQYLTYLLVGASYFLMFGAMAQVVDVALVGLGAVIVPLLLGGYASALSFLLPRVAAILAVVCSVPYLLLSILGLFRITTEANGFIVITSAVFIGVSVVALIWSEGSVVNSWKHTNTEPRAVATG